MTMARALAFIDKVSNIVTILQWLSFCMLIIYMFSTKFDLLAQARRWGLGHKKVGQIHDFKNI